MSRIVLITGVSRGIGRATAALFNREGWNVLGIDREEEGCPDAVSRFFRADVSDAAAVERLSRDIGEKEGHLDALVNNAAIQLCKSTIDTTPEEWDAVMAVNVKSAYLMARALRPLMNEGGATIGHDRRGGAIVNVASVHAIATSQAVAAYAASKGALLSLTRALALELAPDGIRVNAVLPGAVDTPMLRAGLRRGHAGMGSEDERLQRLGERHPLRRVGRPEEIAQAILFLADNERSSFITGQPLVVDGGALCRLSVE